MGDILSWHWDGALQALVSFSKFLSGDMPCEYRVKQVRSGTGILFELSGSPAICPKPVLATSMGEAIEWAELRERQPCPASVALELEPESTGARRTGETA